MNGTCRVCGKKIDVHDVVRGRLCKDPECRRRYAAKVAYEDYQRERAERRQAVEDIRDRALADARHLPVAVLPVNEVGVTPLPEERRAAFADFLRSIVTAAFHEPGERKDPPAPPPGGHPLSRAACALCRGYCCLKGGTHNAFLDSTTIERVRTVRPGATEDDIVAEYLRAIPAKTITDGCCFQSERGCTLSEDLRAGICGEFYCDGLIDFRAELRRTGATEGFATSFRGTIPVRSARLTPDGPKPVDM